MTTRVILSGPVATKGYSSNLPISPTSLVQNGTGPYKYLLTTPQIEVVSKDILEILDYLWTPSSSFCRSYSVDISILYTPNFII
jgi:hypothetical protein